MKLSIPVQRTLSSFRVLALPSLLASLPTLHAAPIATEPFLIGGANYATGTGNLVGQGPASLGFTGNWLPAYNGAQSPSVIAAGLSFTSGTNTVASSGGAIEYPLGGNGRVGRILTTTYTNTSVGNVYFAFMIQNDSIGTGYRGLELHSGGFDDGNHRKLQIVTGEPNVGTANSNYVVRLNNNNNDGFAGDLGEGDTNVNFFVGKITFSETGGQDSISIWRNPTDLTTEAGSNAPTFTKSGFDFLFDRISFARFNGADGFKADEVRIGTSWTDVTTLVNNSDTDNDGLPDTYERTIIDFNAGDLVDDLADVAGPLNSPTTTDFDNDGASDAEEFTEITLPTNRDTDGDGLNDGPETKTGTFVSASNTGSNPLDIDSDDDTLSDGAEVNTYNTNPNVPDTDTDGESDSTEIFQGTDPNDAANNSATIGLVLIDGTRDDALYSTPLKVQTIETGFGDNQNEWNAAYAYVRDGKLNLLFTGNLQDSFNKLEIFVDSKSGGSETFTSAGNDGAGVMDGMIFDAGFAPEYHLIVRRGLSKLDLDIANLTTPTFSNHLNVFGGSDTGRGITGTGLGNTQPITVGYNNSNTAGVLGGSGAADQTAAAAVTTGLELSIDLADLGNPGGPIRVMLIQNSSSHGFLSNQSLAGLPIGTNNLANPAQVDFKTFEGDQFFTVGLDPTQIINGGTAIRFTLDNLIRGVTYRLQQSFNLITFTDIPGSNFIATGAIQVLTLPITPNTEPRKYFRAVRIP